VDAQTEVHAQAAASARARRRIERAARDGGILLSGLRLRLTTAEPATGAPVLAQANAHADGYPVRVQLTAPTLEQAINALCARTERRLEQTRSPWAPRPRPEPDRSAPGPVAGLDVRIARIKRCALAARAPEVAAAHMDAMDYEAHLFIDRECGQICVVHGTGPTGYQLSRLRAVAGSRRVRPPLVIDPRPAPTLDAASAAQRLESTGEAHLFFAEPATGRGCLIYRRYDGHYALVTGDPAAQREADTDHEVGSRVLAGSRG